MKQLLQHICTGASVVSEVSVPQAGTGMVLV